MNGKTRVWVFRVLTGIVGATTVATGALYKAQEALPIGDSVTWATIGTDPIIVLLMIAAFGTGIMQFKEQ